MMQARARQPAAQFYDLPFERIVSDPIRAISDIYDYFEYRVHRRSRKCHARLPRAAPQRQTRVPPILPSKSGASTRAKFASGSATTCGPTISPPAVSPQIRNILSEALGDQRPACRLQEKSSRRWRTRAAPGRLARAMRRHRRHPRASRTRPTPPEQKIRTINLGTPAITSSGPPQERPDCAGSRATKPSSNSAGVIRCSRPEDPFPVWQGDGGAHILAPLFALYDYSFRPDDVPCCGGRRVGPAKVRCCARTKCSCSPKPYNHVGEWCGGASGRRDERRLDEALKEHDLPHCPDCAFPAPSGTCDSAQHPTLIWFGAGRG